MKSSVDSGESVKALHSRSRSSFTISRKTSKIYPSFCDRGRSNDAAWKKQLYPDLGNLTNSPAEGDKILEQDYADQNLSSSEALNSDIRATEVKKFQRNVIYALNQLMKQAEMESEEEFRRMNGLPV